MLIGAQHIITFDHRVINFRGSCSYLLAHDFKDDNFSVIVEYGSQDKHEQPTLLVLLEKDGIKIDLSDDVISNSIYFIIFILKNAIFAEYSDK